MVVLMGVAFGAHGAGLGKLSVFSGIGQPLRAEVAVIAAPAELTSLSARMASHDAFREAGIEYMALLSDVRVEVTKSASGEPVLRLTSARPVDEPFLHFLVELNWTAGRVVREYTFLLDPPDTLRPSRPASVAAPAVPAVKTAPAPAGEPVPESRPAPAHAPVQAAQPVQAPPRVAVELPPPRSAPLPSPAPAAVDDGNGYLVKSGDTLSKIARDHRHESVTLDQMLVSLYDANHEAFVGKNMNRLRAGKILHVPGPSESAVTSPSEARKVVIAHGTDFNAYRRQLAGAVATTAPSASPAERQAVGRIKPRIEDKPLAPAAPKDKLEVSRTEAAKTTVVGGIEEDLIAREKALREAAERIGMLEKNIENLKNLVEIKSQAGVRLQPGSPAAAEPPQTPVPSPAPVKPVEPSPVAPSPASAPKPPAPPAQSVPTPEPSFIDDNPELVLGGGGVLALLLGYLGYSAWRRKKEAARALEEESGDADEFAAEQLDSGAREISREAEDLSIQDNFAESDLLTSSAVVDPVAEADVLMAYGRDAQAEEILQDALQRDPYRTAIHLKLLELHAKQRDIPRFEGVAAQLERATQGRGPEWDKAVGLAGMLGLTGGIFGASAAANFASAADHSSFQPPSAAEIPAASGKSELDDSFLSSLDFDLGSPSASLPESTPAAADLAQASAAQVEDQGLDFDFNLESPETPKAEADSGSASSAEEFKLEEMDFDLDLGSPVDEPAAELAKLEAAAQASVDASAEEARAASGIGDLKLDFDLELDAVPAEEATAAVRAPAAPLVAAPSVAAPVVASVPAQPAAPAVPSATAAPVKVAAAPVPAALPGADLDDVPDNPEVATKLELAQAYEEMGDYDGARELLNEVLNEGSKAQQAQAKAKLDQMNV